MKGYGRTAFMYAAKEGQTDATSILLGVGTDFEIEDLSGRTARHSARTWRNRAVLVNAGARR